MVGAGPRGVLVVPVLLIGFAAGAQAQSEAGYPTFEFAPKEGKPGRVLAVSGTECTLNGRAMQYAMVSLARIVGDSGREPFGASTRHRIDASGGWQGEFVIPVDAPPDGYLIGVTCFASDMAVPGEDFDFTVLDRPPANLTLSSPTVKVGESVEVSVTGCLFEDGTPAKEAVLSLLDATREQVANSKVDLDGRGTASGVLAPPGRVTNPGTGEVGVRCDGSQGAMVGRPEAIVLGAAVPVTPPRVALTG